MNIKFTCACGEEVTKKDMDKRDGARLATGLGGLTLGRAGFAPAGRRTKFHGDITSSNSL
jgi:hypothetical protein